MIVAVFFCVLCAGATSAAPGRPGGFSFASIDGGEIDLAAYRGRPMLVANTASLCAFTPQLADLQTLWERYGDRGLLVLAVPSDDFRQELGSEAEVREFCALTFGIDMPMTTITRLSGAEAHPFWQWLAAEGVVPRWNFHKVLIDRDGDIAGSWPAAVNPLAPEITGAVEAALGD